MSENNEVKKQASIFDFIAGMTYLKKPWSSFSEMDIKNFEPYMINRFLSMNLELLEIVNMFQKFTTSGLGKKEVYNLYLDFLPKQKYYSKYIKGRTTEKYNPKLIEYLKLYFQVSEAEVDDYLTIYFGMNGGKQKLTEILEKYGLDDKIIKKLLTVK